MKATATLYLDGKRVGTCEATYTFTDGADAEIRTIGFDRPARLAIGTFSTTVPMDDDMRAFFDALRAWYRRPGRSSPRPPSRKLSGRMRRFLRAIRKHEARTWKATR